MPNLFARAASLLLGEDPDGSADPDRRLLLQALGYVAAAESPASGGEPGPEARHRACLLTAASRFTRVFELAAPDAPGLVSFGAELDPALADPLHADSPSVSVSGVGLSLQEVSARVSSISPSCRPGMTCSNRPVRTIRLPGLVGARRISSPRSRRIACAGMPNFHGTVQRGSSIAARSCCRQTCVCAGRRASGRSSRRFRWVPDRPQAGPGMPRPCTECLS
jgi:hypothetical protein